MSQDIVSESMKRDKEMGASERSIKSYRTDGKSTHPKNAQRSPGRDYSDWMKLRTRETQGKRSKKRSGK